MLKKIASPAQLCELAFGLAVILTCFKLMKTQECFSCKGTPCRRIRGIFTRPSLPLGYNLITRVPAMACNITVSELTPSNNYLALRAADGYIINGNWNVVPSGRYMGAGTGFLYSHSTYGEGESIYAPGPLTVYTDIMVIYQSKSLSISYEYWQPVSPLEGNPVSFLPQSPPPLSDVSRNTFDRVPSVMDGRPGRGYNGFLPNRVNYPHHQHRYLENVQTTFVSPPIPPGRSIAANGGSSWRVWKFTPCSKTCGGGQQETVHICTSLDGQILEDSNCGESRPPPQTVACNTRPCPPRWGYGDWSQCSATCGTGQMTRSLTCLQDIGPAMTRVLPQNMCTSAEPVSPMSTTQLCNIAPCTRWHVNPWGKCSVECGTGIRMREVICQADDAVFSENQCNKEEKPLHQELCHAHICAKHTWFFTEWTEECVGGCENGMHIRRVWCSPGVNSIESECSLTDRPPNTKPCTNIQACGAAWFSGPWSPCSSQCGNGTKNREVVCVVYLRGSFRATFDNECDPARRPEAVSKCNTEPCPPHWYFTDWTECSRKCGRGSQRRAVQCLDSAQRPSLQCQIDERPITTRPCNTQSCSKTKHGDCVDRFQNCLLVQRSRLCKYSYYKSVCCASCKTQ